MTPLRDYAAWHEGYERPGSPLYLRLLVVQDLVARALDELPPGPLRVVGLCAGQGRDLLTVLARHRRGPDVTARLVELHPENVAEARRRAAAAGLDGVEVVEGDAGTSDAYAGAVPADLVLACGVFGNVTRDDVAATVAFLPRLCAPGARVAWTRGPDVEDAAIPGVREALGRAGFAEDALVVPQDRSFGVGLAHLTGPPLPYEPGRRLFTFVR